MSEDKVTEKQIETALNLSAQRDFSASLALWQEMLPRAQDEQTKMTILFGIVTCSTWLSLDSIRENAMQELKIFSDYDVSNAFAVLTRAGAYIDFGRAQEALYLIDANLSSEVLLRPDFRDWKYEHLFLRGHSLVQLARCDEALYAFDEAYRIDPDGKFEVDMLIDRSNCFLALSRFDEAYDAASRVLPLDNQSKATLAMQYMAECRMWQSRIPEALELFSAVQKRLPCELVDQERIQTGINNAMERLEKSSPQRATAQRKPQ